MRTSTISAVNGPFRNALASQASKSVPSPLEVDTRGLRHIALEQSIELSSGFLPVPVLEGEQGGLRTPTGRPLACAHLVLYRLEDRHQPVEDERLPRTDLVPAEPTGDDEPGARSRLVGILCLGDGFGRAAHQVEPAEGVGAFPGEHLDPRGRLATIRVLGPPGSFSRFLEDRDQVEVRRVCVFGHGASVSWRKRMGVEPTRDRLTAPPGFEVRTPHRGRFSSIRRINRQRTEQVEPLTVDAPEIAAADGDAMAIEEFKDLDRDLAAV